MAATVDAIHPFEECQQGTGDLPSVILRIFLNYVWLLKGFSPRWQGPELSEFIILPKYLLLIGFEWL